ncbi:MAG: GldG family protein, partial [Candidatus Aminicenantes bacterium]|nr:GldG family protein [Candidatus Aminicenantes bacterium]
MNDNKNKYYKFGLYLVMLLLINVAAGSMYYRVDLTSNGLYSLSDASEDAVNSLTEPLTINVFFSRNLPSPYNNVERYLHDILEEYEIHSNKNLSFRFYDVNAKEGDLSEQAEENRKIANSYGIYPVNVQKIEQDEAKIQKAYMGMVFIHGDIVEKIPAVISTEDLE